MKTKLIIYSSALFVLSACIKSRECQCYNSTTDKTDVIFINGNKKDSKNACVNLADSNEVCNLK